MNYILQNDNINYFSNKLQLWSYQITIFIILLFSTNPLFTQVIINEPNIPNPSNLTNNLISNNWIFLTDSINQIKLNSNVRTDLFNIEKDNIELYSLFDGNYNFQFIAPYLDTFNTYSLYSHNINKRNIFNHTTKVNLSAGTNSGSLQFDFEGNYRSFYWLFQPYFDISNGVLFPEGNNTIFNQSLLSGSGYQNILNHLEFGVINSHSSLVFDLNLNISELYIPRSRFDTNSVRFKFNDYNQFLSIVKFSNTFSEDMKIRGKVFFMDSFRDIKPTNDTNIFGNNNEKIFNLEEFNYGINLLVDYNLFFNDNPTIIGLNYKQNLFLFDNNFVDGRQRIETESLNWSLEQKYSYSDRNSIIAIAEYKSKAILLSTLGELPKNIGDLNFGISHIHNSDKEYNLTNSINYSTFDPLVSNYYALNENSLENLALIPEKWIELQNTYFHKIDSNLFYKLNLDIFYGNDIIMQVIDEDNICQYSNIGDKFGAEIGIDFNYSNNNFGIRWQAGFALQNFNISQIMIESGLRMPKFQTKLSYSQNIFNFITFQTDLEYFSGILYFHKAKNMIESANLPILFNVIFLKQFDNSYIFVILKNISNQYYEINFGLPERGLSITLGTKIIF